MIFKQIIFQNYKTYYGSQEVDLFIPTEERSDKNIILFGGLNGAGKTTFLNAILYLLFGKRGLKHEAHSNIEEEYTKLFSNVINHQYFDEGGRNCSVTLVLQMDNLDEYTIKVEWHVTNQKKISLEERKISFRRSGARHTQSVQVGSEEAFYRYIDQIIPFYASPFFMFDGEEIKTLIDKQNNKTIKEAITKICGLQKNDVLIDDLKTLHRRISNELTKVINNKEQASIQEKLNTIEEDIQKRTKSFTKNTATLNEYKNQKITLQKRRDEKLLMNTNSRDSLVQNLGQLESTVAMKNNKLLSILDGELQHLILFDKIKNLQKQLLLEENAKNQETIRKAKLRPYEDFIENLLEQPIVPSLTANQIEQIKEYSKLVWFKDQKDNISETDINYLHDLNQANARYLKNISPYSKSAFSQLINEIQRTENEIQHLEEELLSAPDALSVEDEDQKIEVLTKKIGETELRLRTSKKSLQRLNNEKSSLSKKISKQSESLSDSKVLYEKKTYLERTILALEEYQKQYTDYKTNQIKEEFEFMLKKLFRKQDEFSRIEFDSSSYIIRIYNDLGQEISIADRSAGEKQMIASALIWALTRASDLKLPIIIDTPLGRLDSHHRQRLIEHYYRQLSEQVIILSTDTEVTEGYKNIMSEASHKEYLLDYDPDKKYTIIRDGYFDFLGVE